jgi:hypothetical protein
MKTQFSAEASLDRDKFTVSLRPITMDRIRGKIGRYPSFDRAEFVVRALPNGGAEGGD